MKYIDAFRDPEAAQAIAESIAAKASRLPDNRAFSIMEVCGSHTMAIGRYAIRDLLPKNIHLISGPGCPVCVTSAGYIDAALELASRDNVTIATFGDMINVPGSETSLAKARSDGARVEVCYSPLHAVELAEKEPERQVVFLAIGFETTICPVISLVKTAVAKGLKNLSLLVAFKQVPPALEALVTDPEIRIDAFLCPAHVSAIIGVKAYEPFVAKHKIPCVIAGFEPLDILLGLDGIIDQFLAGEANVVNQYSRVVRNDGNVKAQDMISYYLEDADVSWRGIGVIPGSGLALKPEFAQFDAERKFDITISSGTPNKACRCGDVLKGKILPTDCPLFAKACNPRNPIGPCMVSSEGSCSAYYKYSR